MLSCVVDAAGALIRSISTRSAAVASRPSVSSRHSRVDSVMILSISASSSSSLVEKCW